MPRAQAPTAPSVCAAFKTSPGGKVPTEEDLHEQERGRLASRQLLLFLGTEAKSVGAAATFCRSEGRRLDASLSFAVRDGRSPREALGTPGESLAGGPARR